LVEEEAADEALPSVNTIVRARNTPRLIVRVNGFSALPDTGACLSIISPSWVEEFDLWHTVDTSAPPRLTTATGGVMDAKGTIDLQLTVLTQGKPAASTRVTFTVGLVKHGMIIGWEDLIRLGVIHPAFPEPIREAVRPVFAVRPASKVRHRLRGGPAPRHRPAAECGFQECV
jgi:hypothetical protein